MSLSTSCCRSTATPDWDDDDDDDARSCSAPEVYAAFVRKLINWLTVKTGEGDLFEIDTALRPNGSSGLLVIGSITALFMGFLGIIQNDIKRVVAYSTLSQLGYMTVALTCSSSLFLQRNGWLLLERRGGRGSQARRQRNEVRVRVKSRKRRSQRQR